LERLLEVWKAEVSLKRAAELTHNMYALSYTLPNSSEEKRQILKMSQEQQAVYEAVQKG